MKILKKLFIKDFQKTDLPEVRCRYGFLAGIFGICSNSLLFAAKLIIGLISHSIAIIADAVNNVSDAGSSVVTLFGFKMSSRPADKEHPYGHARFEYVAAFMVSIIVMVIGVLLAKESVVKIVSPNGFTKVSVLTYVVLGAAIVVKLLQMCLYLNFAKAISSKALKASAIDSRNDVITTFVTLISSIIISTTGVDVDGYFGAAVSIFIVISALILVKETMDPLIGGVPDKELVENIKNKILSYDGVLGVHDLMVHNYGAGVSFAIAHVEVSADVDVLISHDLIDNIEREFEEDLHIQLSIHMDPIKSNDETTNELRARVANVLTNIESDISFHDFRIVEGATHTNILFDVVLPWESKQTKEDILAELRKEFENDTRKYYFIINVDRNFVE